MAAEIVNEVIDGSQSRCWWQLDLWWNYWSILVRIITCGG